MNYEPDDIKAMQDIVCKIDTGAGKDYIIKDLPQYNEIYLRMLIREMLADNLLIDKGGTYLVFNYRDERARKIVYG